MRRARAPAGITLACLCRIPYVTDAVSRSAAQRVYIRLSAVGRRTIDRAGERRSTRLQGEQAASVIITNSCYFSARLTICRVVCSPAVVFADQWAARPRRTAPRIVGRRMETVFETRTASSAVSDL